MTPEQIGENLAPAETFHAVDAKDLFLVETLADVFNNPPPRSPVLIEGLLRQGHKMILSGPSKAGKSFALLQLAAALAEGRNWMQFFKCEQSKVLYLNLEIDRPSMIDRVKKIYEAQCWTPYHLENFDFIHLRGVHVDIEIMTEAIIRKAKAQESKAIFIDPIYKMGMGDENSAGDVANLCRALDRITAETGAALIYGHHFTKGVQDTKAAIDRASGSGVFARDPDAILTLTELQETGCFRLETILREFPPSSPLSLRYQYPLHIPDPALDAMPLAGARGKYKADREQEAAAADKRKAAELAAIHDRIVEIARLQTEPKVKGKFVDIVCGKTGLSQKKATAIVEALIDDGRLQETVERGNNNRKLISYSVSMTQGKMF